MVDGLFDSRYCNPPFHESSLLYARSDGSVPFRLFRLIADGRGWKHIPVPRHKICVQAFFLWCVNYLGDERHFSEGAGNT